MNSRTAQIERTDVPAPATPMRARKAAKNFWKKQARIWHWISGAVCLVGMVLFAVTGITLNHAGDIPAEPVTRSVEAQLPDEMISILATQPEEGMTGALPPEIIRQLRRDPGVNVSGRAAEWTDVDVYVGLPRPGGDGWLAIDRETGLVEYEHTSRGAISYLNDLHKGRDTGPAWALFLDVFSVATIFFCLTGLWLLQIHSAKRAITWPLTLIGVAIPVVVLVLFVH
ncbi:MAG: hypothetical protein CME88_09835 [Hirschia sp.]|nr:hypothetical protein [Hirschia sp.]MBF18667.1 hypothetical protein [Hirschia sp.]